MIPWIEASCRVYRVLLLIYPQRLRAEFGSEMLSLFEQQLLDARREGGRAEAFGVWWRVFRETTYAAVLASIEPNAFSIGLISVLSSSALFVFLFWAARLARHCVK
jgi:hypothetical protein